MATMATSGSLSLDPRPSTDPRKILQCVQVYLSSVKISINNKWLSLHQYVNISLDVNQFIVETSPVVVLGRKSELEIFVFFFWIFFIRYLDRESLYVMNHIILKLSTLDPSGNEKIMCKSTHANEQLQQKKVQRLQQHEQLAEKILFNIIIFRAYVNNGASMDLLGKGICIYVLSQSQPYSVSILCSFLLSLSFGYLEWRKGLQDPRQFDAGTFMEKVKVSVGSKLNFVCTNTIASAYLFELWCSQFIL